MIALAKYFLWNGVLMGTIILSTVFKLEFMLTIMTWLIGIETFFYIVACGSGDETKRTIFAKAKDGFKPWKVPFEVIYMAVVFGLGHPIIGTFMFVSCGCYVYLLLCKHQFRMTDEVKP